MEDVAETYEAMQVFFERPEVLERAFVVDPMKVATFVVHYLSGKPGAVAFGSFENEKMVGLIAGDVYTMAVNDLTFAEDRVLYAPKFAEELLSAFENWAFEQGCKVVQINAVGSRNNEAMDRWLQIKGYTQNSYRRGKVLQ